MDKPKTAATFLTRQNIIFALSLIALVVSAYWLYSEWQQPDGSIWEPLGGVITSIIAIISLRPQSDDATREERPNKIQKTNRDAMLEKVELYWIKGVLDEIERPKRTPLHPVTSLTPDKVLNGVDVTGLPIKTTADIRDAFDKMRGKLLITGAPGSGKTTAMLQLARQLIADARNDPTKPIPVVLNLSSWAEQQAPIHKWLHDQLVRNYQIPKQVAREWIGQEKLLILFDGLDEVAYNPDEEAQKIAEAYRDACIDAINTFLDDHRTVGVCICSRSAELAALKQKLDLRGAIELQPLTPAQIELYLRGDDLKGLRTLMLTDDSLSDMANIPFMLNAMAFAYSGQDEIQLRLPPGKDGEAGRRHDILEQYVNKQLQRPLLEADDYQPPKPNKTRHYLRWLAYHLTDKKQIMFYIENLQADWLTRRQQRGYAVWRAVAGLSAPLFLSLFSTFGIGELALVCVLLFYNKSIQPVGQLNWKRSSRLIAALTVGLIAALVTGTPIAALGCAPLVWLIIALSGGILAKNTRVEVRRLPNQAIYTSLHSACIFALIVFLAVALFISGYLTAFFAADGVLGATLFLSTSAVLIGALGGGGAAVIKHYALRAVLARSGDTPPIRHYPAFLDYCTDINLLRRVGGGYIFVHRYLMEYFAAQYTLPEA